MKEVIIDSLAFDFDDTEFESNDFELLNQNIQKVHQVNTFLENGDTVNVMSAMCLT